MLQTYIPFLPKGAKPINNHVAIYYHDEKIEFFTATGPIYSCRESDMYGVRLAQGIIVTEATSQCWSDGKEVAIPLEIRLIVQRVRAPHG